MKNYCKVATGYGYTMPNYPIRRGAIYGASCGRLFVCESFADIKNRHLFVAISRNNGASWAIEETLHGEKIYDAIIDCIRTDCNNHIPRVGSFRDPKATGRVVGQPLRKNPQKSFTPDRLTYSEIRKMNRDNADFGGGGDAIMMHVANNHMKVIVGKNTDKPEWRHPSKFGLKNPDRSQHEGAIHEIGEPLTVCNKTAGKRR